MEFSEDLIISNLQHLTHNRTGFKGAMLEPEDLEHACPLDNGRRDTLGTATLGTLQTLPVEILQMILLDLDLQSLTMLRRVNCRTRMTIDALWQYNEIITYASNSLRAVLSINLGASVSCRQLHRELCSQECVACGRFGAFLYLLTCSRVCYVCLVEDARFLPLTPKHARTAFALSSDDIGKLTTALSLPGRYSHNSKIRRTRISLVDRTASRQAGINRHKSAEQMEEYVSRLQVKKVSDYEAKAQVNRIAGFRNPPRPAYSEVFDAKGGNPHRFMCVVKFPWLDRDKGMVEHGLNCTGCRDEFHDRTEGKRDWRWLYTARGYVEHVRHCWKSVQVLESIV